MIKTMMTIVAKAMMVIMMMKTGSAGGGPSLSEELQVWTSSVTRAAIDETHAHGRVHGLRRPKYTPYIFHFYIVVGKMDQK